MAERKSAEDEFNPRHRIIGAVILVALAVIFLPMLLSEQPPAPRGITNGDLPVTDARVAATRLPLPSEKPAADSGKSTRVVTVPVEPVPAGPVVNETPTRNEPAKPETSKPAKPAPEVAGTGVPAPAETKPGKSATASKPATSDPGHWVVQVGVFSQLENAKRLQDKLRQKGYAVMLDPPKPAAGKNVRVEVGPYKDQAAARAAATRIQQDVGIKGVVRSD